MELTELLNPLKAIRTNDLHKTGEQLAKEAGINLAAIGQQEDGLYPSPIPAYLLAIGILPGSQDEIDITKEYHNWQTLVRQQNGLHGLRRLIPNPRFTLDENPLYSWRVQSSLTTYRFCSSFCVHMPTVNSFEKKITSLHRIPPVVLSTPLIEGGYDLDEFTEASILYKAHLLDTARRLNNLPPVA